MANEMKRFVSWKLRQQKYYHFIYACYTIAALMISVTFPEMLCSLLTNQLSKASVSALGHNQLLLSPQYNHSLYTYYVLTQSPGIAEVLSEGDQAGDT